MHVQGTKGYRWSVYCRGCKTTRIEEIAGATTEREARAVIEHECHATTEGPGGPQKPGVLAYALEVRPVIWRSGDEHGCGVRCVGAKGPVCHCECQGQLHGRLRFKLMAGTDDQMTEIYRRLMS